MKVLKATLLGILCSFAMGSVAHGEVSRLSESQKEILAEIIGKVRNCDYYSVNFGANKPYNETCVKRLIETTILATRLVDDSSLRSFQMTVNSILNCPVYSVNFGVNKPIEEVCVNNAVTLAQGLLK